MKFNAAPDQIKLPDSATHPAADVPDATPGDLHPDLVGSYSSLRNNQTNTGNNHTFLKDRDGKADVISRERFKQKYEQAEPDAKPLGVRRPGSVGSVAFPNQSPVAKEQAKPGTESEKQQELVDNWALSDSKDDAEGVKQAEDEILAYLIDAKSRGIITDDEAVNLVERMWQRKEASLTGHKELYQRLAGKLAELHGKKSAAEPAATSPEPEPNPILSTEESLLDFIDASDSDDKDMVLFRYEKLKEWGMEPDLGSRTEQEWFDYLLDENQWLDIIDEARYSGYLPDSPSVLKGGTLLPPPAPEAKPVPTGIIEIPKELKDSLDIARDEFVRLTVQNRGASFRGGEELRRAKEAYEQARNAAGAFVANRLKEAGANDEQLKAFAKQGALLELHTVNFLTKDSELSQVENKKLRGFYDWWARQDTGGNGRMGRFIESFKPKNWRKAGSKKIAMAAIGFVPGMAIAAVGAAILSPVAGGIAGVGAARGLNKGLLGVKANRGAGAKAAIEARAANQIVQGEAAIAASDNLDSHTVSDVVQQETLAAKKNNRWDVVGSGAIGTIAGGAAVHVLDMIRGGSGGPTGGSAPDPEGGPTGPLPDEPITPAPQPESPITPPAPEVPDAPEVPKPPLEPEAPAEPRIPVSQEITPEDLVDPATQPDFSSYEYPWDWAEQRFGGNNAMAKLHELSDRAGGDGHVVEWHNVGDGNGVNDWLEIDGRSDAPYVLEVLNRYAEEGANA